jgi:CHAT domain-containing protein
MGSVGDLDAALRDMDAALAATPPSSPARAGYLTNRATHLSKRYARMGDATDLEAALADIDVALASTPPDSPIRPGIHTNRATHLSKRYARMGDAADLDAAVASFREACRTGLGPQPDAVVTAARSWLAWATERTAWGEVTEAGSFGLEAADALIGVQAVRPAKVSRLRDVRGLGARTSCAWAKLGDGRGAVIAAERSRAVLLAEAVAVRSTLRRLEIAGRVDLANAYVNMAEWLASARGSYPAGAGPEDARSPGQPVDHGDLDTIIGAIRAVPGFEGFLVRLSDDEVFAQVMARASEQPLVYLVPGTVGGVTLIARGGGSVQIIDLPQLTESALAELVATYFDAYNALRKRRVSLRVWRGVLEELTRRLGDVVGRPLVAALHASAIEHVTLVPLGPLGLLPVHAAVVEEGTPGSGPRCLLDDICVTYSPSAQALSPARTEALGEDASILAVDEPWPVLASPLRGSGPEVIAAVRWFQGRSTVLQHQRTTKDAVLAALAGHDVVHLSCHGAAVPGDPLKSSLLMAFDQELTLADLLGRRLDGTRLVVLSACETAIPGTELLDEVVSLPAGLLQAGAAAVIGSLWSVDDLATMVLLSRFYQSWRGDGLPLAEALRQAQRWVRDCTHDERDAAFPEIDFTGSGEPGDHPYPNPYWWAGFTLTGM